MTQTANHFVQKSTTRASDLQKNSREQDCGDTTKISESAKVKFATTEQSAGSNWRCHEANRYAIASHEFNHLRVTRQTSLAEQLRSVDCDV